MYGTLLGMSTSLGVESRRVKQHDFAIAIQASSTSILELRGRLVIRQRCADAVPLMNQGDGTCHFCAREWLWERQGSKKGDVITSIIINMHIQVSGPPVNRAVFGQFTAVSIIKVLLVFY